MGSSPPLAAALAGGRRGDEAPKVRLSPPPLTVRSARQVSGYSAFGVTRRTGKPENGGGRKGAVPGSYFPWAAVRRE